MARVVNFDYEFPSTVEAVLFNGRKVKRDLIRFADDATGELVIYKTDKQGYFLFDSERQDSAVTSFKGKVEIVFK